jgi:hypothetical protein
MFLVTFAGRAFGVHSDYGLHVIHWLISIAFGSISLVVSILLKIFITIDEHSSFGFGGKKVGDIRTKTVLHIKRNSERINRDLAKNGTKF